MANFNIISIDEVRAKKMEREEAYIKKSEREFAEALNSIADRVTTRVNEALAASGCASFRFSRDWAGFKVASGFYCGGAPIINCACLDPSEKSEAILEILRQIVNAYAEEGYKIREEKGDCYHAWKINA